MQNIFDKKLILVAGKGGVGRSTVAAAIASACAERGRKTLFFEANARDRVAELFGHSTPLGPTITQFQHNLYGVNTAPSKALEEYGMMILRFRRIYELVFENRVSRAFLRAIPGLDDYSILGKAWHHSKEKERGARRWDTVVFDLPASGHSVSMLRIPWIIASTVPEGPLTRDARAIKSLLVNPDETALVIVTLAEEMPVNEASELSTRLQELIALTTAALVVNQIYPSTFARGTLPGQVLSALEGLDQGNPLASLVAHGALTQSRRLLNESYLKVLRQRFPLVPLLELPLLFAPRFGPEQLAALRAHLPAARP